MKFNFYLQLNLKNLILNLIYAIKCVNFLHISFLRLNQALCEEFEEESCVALANTITRHLGEAEQAKAAGNPSWWKIHEACMMSLGSAQEVIIKQIKDGNVQFDLGGFMENIVLPNIANNFGKLFNALKFR